MCAKTMRPTYVRASVGSRMSGSWLRATTRVFFCACATPAASARATSAAVTSASGDVIRRMNRSSRIRAVGSLGLRDGAHDNSRRQAMGDGLRAGYGAAILGGDAELVEAGAPTLLDLARLGHQHGRGRGRRQIADGHAERDGALAMRVAGGAEGHVGQREDHAAVRIPLKVDHV